MLPEAPMTTLFWQRLDSPVGSVVLIGDEEALYALWFGESPEKAARWIEQRLEPLELVERPGFGGYAELLGEYFAGRAAALDEIPVRLIGTDFQNDVWRALRQIPPGRTATYGELAKKLGRPGAARAVGMANHDNPLALIVPCHRVIGADGSLTGYAGGLDRKRELLALEGAAVSETLFPLAG
jgi:methylated-DNA-[protein]-cysteine S-methyltransferase